MGGMNNSQLSNMWGGMAGRGPLAMGGGRGMMEVSMALSSTEH